MKIKKTYDEIVEYVNLSTAYAAKKEKEKQENKLTYAIIKVGKKLQNKIRKLNEKISEINIDHCLTDEKTGAILKDAKGDLCYSKEGMKNRNLAVQSIIGETEYEIDTYFTTEVPPDLTQYEVEVFTGIVIEPKPEQKTEN